MHLPAAILHQRGAEFTALTGVKIGFEEIPPGQIRNKTALDLSSKTGTYSTSFTDPMYYPLYASNKWVDALDGYVADANLTDAKWYAVDDVICVLPPRDGVLLKNRFRRATGSERKGRAAGTGNSGCGPNAKRANFSPSTMFDMVTALAAASMMTSMTGACGCSLNPGRR